MIPTQQAAPLAAAPAAPHPGDHTAAHHSFQNLQMHYSPVSVPPATAAAADPEASAPMAALHVPFTDAAAQPSPDKLYSMPGTLRNAAGAVSKPAAPSAAPQVPAEALASPRQAATVNASLQPPVSPAAVPPAAYSTALPAAGAARPAVSPAAASSKSGAASAAGTGWPAALPAAAAAAEAAATSPWSCMAALSTETISKPSHAPAAGADACQAVAAPASPQAAPLQPSPAAAAPRTLCPNALAPFKAAAAAAAAAGGGSPAAKPIRKPAPAGPAGAPAGGAAAASGGGVRNWPAPSSAGNISLVTAIPKPVARTFVDGLTSAAPGAGGRAVHEHDNVNTANVSALLASGAFKLRPLVDFVDYEALKVMRLEDGLEASRKEAYLSDQQFAEVFGMDRAAFDVLPAWRRTQAKKDKHLF